MMKTNTALMVLPALLLIGANANAFEAIARVTNVTPITETVSHPSQQCWSEYQQSTRTVSPEHNYGGAVLGTIVGGVVGSRFGKGNGKLVGTAAGAAIGAVTGDHIANRDAHAETRTVTTPVQRCETVDNFETRTTGYRVTYEYDNYKFTTRLPYHPGNQMRVNVAVTPR
jgi:uncharacterized protein YcfJ